MEIFEVSGQWWEPNKSTKKHEGNLSFDLNHGIKLALNNNWKLIVPYGEKRFIKIKKTNQYFPSRVVFTEPIVINESYFETEDAIYHLLGFELLTMKVKVAIKCKPSTDINFVKRHIQKDDKLTIFKLISYPQYKITFNGLEEWAKSYFSHNEVYDKLIYIDKAKINISKDEKGSIYFEVSKRSNNFITLYKAIEIIDDLRNFLISASKSYIILKDFQAIDLNNEVHPIYWYNLEMKLPNPTSYNWVFELIDVANSLPTLIKNFCDKRKLLAPFINNYLRHRYIVNVESYFHEIQFLSYMQALEGFFKLNKEYQVPSNQSLHSYMKKILPLRDKDTLSLEGIDQHLENLLSEESSRLEAIYFYILCKASHSIPDDCKDKIFICWDKDHKSFNNPIKQNLKTISSEIGIDNSLRECLYMFTARIIELRNLLTHEAVHTLDNWDIYYYNVRLEVIIQILIYKQMGLDDEFISSTMKIAYLRFIRR